MLEVVALLLFGWFGGHILEEAVRLVRGELEWRGHERSIESWTNRPFQAHRMTPFALAMMRLGLAFDQVVKGLTRTVEVDDRKLRR